MFSDDPSFDRSRACGFSVTVSGTEPALLIGPWIAGDWSARWQWSAALPARPGTIRGRYRTDGVLPFTAEVSYAWMKGGEKLRREGVALAPADRWTPFEVEVRRPPDGADGVKPAFGLSQHTDGRVWFADLTWTGTAAGVSFPAIPPALIRPASPRKLAAGPRVRLEYANDAWWLVTPAGRPFYSIGTDVPGMIRAAEGDRLAARLRKWRFNSLGGWSNVWKWGKLDDRIMAQGGSPFYAFHAVETSGLEGCGRLTDPGDREPPGDHAFPDPFDPAFAPAYRRAVADVASVAAGKPWFAGWFLDNERDHGRLDRRVWSGHAGKAFREWLERKYGGTAGLNAAWGTSFPSFDAVAGTKPVVVAEEGPLWADCLEFSREIVRRYVTQALEVLRKADPGSLVFSNRFMMGGVGDTLRYLDLYSGCDGIAVNLYPANRSVGLSANERAVLEEIHRRTGKPILIGEWSVPALDSGLYTGGAKPDWSYPEAVETQTDRARQAAAVTADLFNLPFVVGAHWFTWRDFDSSKRRANRGLLRASGQPWRELTDALSEIHARMR